MLLPDDASTRAGGTAGQTDGGRGSGGNGPSRPGAAPGASTGGDETTAGARSGNGSDPGGDSSAGGASVGVASPDSGFIDPHVAERKQLADQLCALLKVYPCLHYFTTYAQIDKPLGADDAALCSQDVQILASLFFDGPCFDLWAAEMKCIIDLPYTCPCQDTACQLAPPGLGANNGCAAEDAALVACSDKSPRNGRNGQGVRGSYGSCVWATNGHGTCQVSCSRDQVFRNFTSACSGSPDGPQACTCMLNGVPLHDGPGGDSAYDAHFYADNCAGVAQLMADGQCDRVLNCCFTWTPQNPGMGVPDAPQCSCTADPKKRLFEDTCADAAAKGGGKVVDLCPQYVPSSGVFPWVDAGPPFP